MQNKGKYFRELKKEYQKRFDRELSSHVRGKRNETGHSEIVVRLNGEENLFHPLSPDHEELHPEIYDYIEMQAEPIPSPIPVCICFSGNIPEERTQKDIVKAYQRHTFMKLQKIRRNLRLNRWKTAILLAIGLLLLGTYFTMQFLQADVLFLEFLSIAGTFSVWEAVDLFLLEKTALKVEYYNALQMACAELKFRI